MDPSQADRPPPEAGSPHPFHTRTYLQGLDNIGEPVADGRGRFHLLRRPIPGSALFDGAGPWPYYRVSGDEDLRTLREGFADLVTITAVTQPGYVPPADQVESIFLKDHFAYDPCLPRTELSRRTAKRLQAGLAISRFEVADDRPATTRMAAEMTPLYRRQATRRGFSEFFRSFSDTHFTSIADLDAGRYFKVTIDGETGAMACGILHQGVLQILHIAISDIGLRHNASYVLMSGLLEQADEAQAKLLTGGMPDSARDTLETFKRRWANSYEPVHLLRIVNDRRKYEALSANRDPKGFFPAYRQAIVSDEGSERT